MISHPTASRYGVANSIRWSYYFSAMTCAHLDWLADNPGLPEAKGDTARISTTRWHIQARFIRLRSLSVAVTALAAGIVTAAELTRVLYTEPNRSAKGPPLPFPSDGLLQDLRGRTRDHLPDSR